MYKYMQSLVVPTALHNEAHIYIYLFLLCVGTADRARFENNLPQGAWSGKAGNRKKSNKGVGRHAPQLGMKLGI